MVKKLFAVFSIVVVIVILSSCGVPDTNDGKCDICGKDKYAKLSDGNEYCYKHWKSAIEYYLDD